MIPPHVCAFHDRMRLEIFQEWSAFCRYAVVDEARQVADEEREIRTLEIPEKLEDGLRVEVFDEWQVMLQPLSNNHGTSEQQGFCTCGNPDAYCQVQYWI